ncbi:MAG: hypothetical protein NC831_05870 [Candidatus Omnitrophica bacterium]|nr:hypothetical protein [Candidatus Omnitrophota bacterium]MCM8828722.1 hypothetical protein [Candidatus Omnitrophota bacterium]
MKKNGLISKPVVLDTVSSWIYTGILEREDAEFYYLIDADAFGASEVNMTKHEYLTKVKKDGIVANRKRTVVSKGKVIAITLLEDIIEK